MSGVDLSEGTGALQRMDPRIKILGALALSMVLAVREDWRIALAGLIAGLLVAVLARIPLRAVGLRLLAVNVFVLLLWLTLPFSTPGKTVLDLGLIQATDAGLRLSMLITLKSNAIVLVLLLLLGTSTLSALAHGLHHLYVPDKLVQVFGFTIRYLDLLFKEYERLRTSMKVRGFTPKTDRHTYKSYAHLLGMLLVRSVERSERVYQAMLCRGFKGTFPSYHHFHFSSRDLIALMILAAFSLLLALI